MSFCIGIRKWVGENIGNVGQNINPLKIGNSYNTILGSLLLGAFFYQVSFPFQFAHKRWRRVQVIHLRRGSTTALHWMNVKFLCTVAREETKTTSSQKKNVQNDAVRNNFVKRIKTKLEVRT